MSQSKDHVVDPWRRGSPFPDVDERTTITAKDIANAAMGRSAVKQVRVTRMPPTRAAMCDGCPFGPNVDGFTALKCEVLKDELRARPQAVWMCHETAAGGAQPTKKSIICKGFVDWKGC